MYVYPYATRVEIKRKIALFVFVSPRLKRERDINRRVNDSQFIILESSAVREILAMKNLFVIRKTQPSVGHDKFFSHTGERRPR